jgi:hypothetical protein
VQKSLEHKSSVLTSYPLSGMSLQSKPNTTLNIAKCQLKGRGSGRSTTYVSWTSPLILETFSCQRNNGMWVGHHQFNSIHFIPFHKSIQKIDSSTSKQTQQTSTFGRMEILLSFPASIIRTILILIFTIPLQ